MLKLLFTIIVLFQAQLAIAAGVPILGHRIIGSGPENVIVLHDWMGDASNYDAAIPWLNLDAHTYIFADVRGYGMSRQITGNYNSDEVAGDVLALSCHLGLQRFHLVGHSMNGLAGFKTILRDWKRDQQIKSFIAVAPVTPDGFPATEEDKAFLQAAISDDQTADAAFGALTGGVLGSTWGSLKTARSRESSSTSVLKGYYEMWLKEDFSVALEAAQVDVPVLVIGGRNDLPGFSESHYDQTLAKWLPNISFSYIDSAGHYPMQETPVLFASLVEKHILNSVRQD